MTGGKRRKIPGCYDSDYCPYRRNNAPVHYRLSLNSQNPIINEKNIEKFREKISILANTKKIPTEYNLRIFMEESFKIIKNGNNIEKSVLFSAINILECLIIEGKIPAFQQFNKYKNLLFFQYGDYIDTKHENFDNYKNLDRKNYIEIIYEINFPFFKSQNIYGDSYIGHTKYTAKQRLANHIKSAFKELINCQDENQKNLTNKFILKLPSRLISLAILSALQMEYCQNNKTLYDLITFYYNEIKDRKPRFQDKKYLDLANRLLDKELLKMNILELHFSSTQVSYREKLLKQTYKKAGTLKPNGLNMTDRRESTKEKGYNNLPMYDIAFLIALGIKTKNILSYIERNYGIKTNQRNLSTQICHFFISKNNAIYELWKPVFESVVEAHYDANLSDIARALGSSYRISSLESRILKRNWYGENISLGKIIEAMRYTALKDLEFNWNNIEEILILSIENPLIRGHSVKSWINWFIKDLPATELAKKAGYSEKGFNNFFKLEIVKKLLGIFASKSAAVRKFRRLKVFEILSEEKNPSLKTLENIWRYEFGLKAYSYDLMSRMKSTYMDLFDEPFIKRIEDIIDVYGCIEN